MCRPCSSSVKDWVVGVLHIHESSRERRSLNGSSASTPLLGKVRKLEGLLRVSCGSDTCEAAFCCSWSEGCGSEARICRVFAHLQALALFGADRVTDGTGTLGERGF